MHAGDLAADDDILRYAFLPVLLTNVHRVDMHIVAMY